MAISNGRAAEEAEGEWDGPLVNWIQGSILVTVRAYSLRSIVINLSTSPFSVKLSLQLSGITQFFLFVSSYRFSLVRLD